MNTGDVPAVEARIRRSAENTEWARAALRVGQALEGARKGTRRHRRPVVAKLLAGAAAPLVAAIVTSMAALPVDAARQPAEDAAAQKAATNATPEKQLTQELERLLARLRAATTEKEKQRLERAIVEFFLGELRGTWLAVDFTLEAVDIRNNAIRATITGTTLMVDGLLLARDTRVWIDGQEARSADLRVGMHGALQLEAESTQRRIVGVRAGRPPSPPAAAEMDRLLGQLNSANFAEREAASRALAALGDRAREALQRAADSPDAEVRRRADSLLQAQQRKKGTWFCSLSHEAPPDPSRVCSIRQANGKLLLINENGDQTEATVLLDRKQIEVAAFSWGEMRGRLEMDKDGTRIKWPNGTKWTQKQP